MNERQLKELETCPTKYKGIIERAYKVECSPRSAIKAFCLYCTGYQRLEVKNCTSLACPLYPFRPYQTDAEDSAEVAESAS